MFNLNFGRLTVSPGDHWGYIVEAMSLSIPALRDYFLEQTVSRYTPRAQFGNPAELPDQFCVHLLSYSLYTLLSKLLNLLYTLQPSTWTNIYESQVKKSISRSQPPLGFLLSCYCYATYTYKCSSTPILQTDIIETFRREQTPGRLAIEDHTLSTRPQRYQCLSISNVLSEISKLICCHLVRKGVDFHLNKELTIQHAYLSIYVSGLRSQLDNIVRKMPRITPTLCHNSWFWITLILTPYSSHFSWPGFH